MSTWPSHPSTIPRPSITETIARRPTTVRVNRRHVIAIVGLILILAAQGVAITQSALWAAPLLCLLFVCLAADLPIVPLLGLLLLGRVLTDDSSSTAVHRSASVDLSGVIAVLLILVAIGLLLRRQRAVGPAAVAALWLCVWTVVATRTDGASTVTIREGLREMSIVALAVIVFNSGGILSIRTITRMIQFVGLASASLALYQLATHTGMLVGSEIRANGTFSHPNSAAVYFAIATTASVWRFLEYGHRQSDALLGMLYSAATIATFSLGGLACLLVMLLAIGLLRPGATRLKLGSCAVALLVLVGFSATPLGAERLASETTTNFNQTTVHGADNSSLGWRFYKWRTLIPEWERAPLWGQGLGTTALTEGTEANHTAGNLPHSEVVRYLVETGLVGFGTLAAGVVFLIKRLWRRRRILGAYAAAPTLGLAIIFGLMISGLADNTILYTPGAYAAAAILAAVLVTPTNHKPGVTAISPM
jgi:O-antigen ligase